MNKTYKYLAMAALALGVVACQQDEEFASLHSDVVRIASANIAAEVDTRVNTLNDGNAFETDDQILLVNESRTNKNSGYYTYSGSAWSTSDMVLYASGTNTFKAYYPAQESFVLPVDQSTPEGIKSADRMIASATATKGNAVSLSFTRQMAKVTVTVTMNSEFSSTATISSLTINSNGGKQVTPYTPDDSNNSYTAVLTPGTYTSGATFIEVTVGNKTMTVPVNSTLTNGLQAGKHYTFSLTVGKEAVISNDVTVKSWTTTAINNGEAEEMVIPYLTFTAQYARKLKMTLFNSYTLDNSLQYSVDNGEWQQLKANVEISFGGNKNLRIRGKSLTGTATNANCYAQFRFDSYKYPVACTGDIRTLIDYENYSTVSTENARFCSLFQGLSNLTSVPDLPATKLASVCYNDMFAQCSSLVTVQDELPATELSSGCYYRMFYGCTGLTTAPVLPAQTLVENCYGQMFAFCEDLKSVVMLATDVTANGCLSSWLSNVAASGTITLKSGVTLPINSESGIPEGWSVINKQ